MLETLAKYRWIFAIQIQCKLSSIGRNKHRQMKYIFLKIDDSLSDVTAFFWQSNFLSFTAVIFHFAANVRNKRKLQGYILLSLAKCFIMFEKRANNNCFVRSTTHVCQQIEVTPEYIPNFKRLNCSSTLCILENKHKLISIWSFGKKHVY